MQRLATLVLVMATTAAVAQPARLDNAEVRTVAAGASFEQSFTREVAAADTARWMGYAVPALGGHRFHCDWSSSRSWTSTTPVKLEGPDTLYVLFRVENRSVSRIRIFSEGCPLDGGGLPLVWFTGVVPADSLALVGGFAASASSRRVQDGALAALAMHAGPAAAARLIDLARAGTSTHLRGQALFWVAQRAGDQAIPTIADAIDRDPETEVKKKAVFALSQLPANEGVPRLIEVAEHHSNAAVRRQAMFWLGQSRDPRALAFFERILNR